ncbi:DUF2334 domain-containing protein [Candidatus Macondimonas diazotrophica]|uniref:DUF2334 domain-containing protein n=1 Tax=Candidatus Macondimonas diazotrophica TaxID=2305248 RepID=UPI001432702B|nr:polysaccharide deacetylase family protein [Candidatus Macondimonas diazotrophica]NCU01437.1 DUF2334 domain-containing protein [Candidatus Macondimonas diazotrophica]
MISNPSRGTLMVVLHDVAPQTWGRYRVLLETLDRSGIPCSLLVVTDYHGQGGLPAHPEFVAALRLRRERGDEIVFHGVWHQDKEPLGLSPRQWILRRLYTAREGEFAALSAPRALGRVAHGLQQLADVGLTAQGFVAPAWLMSRGTRQALPMLPMRYAAGRRCLYRLPDWQVQPQVSLVWSVRSRTRRVLSRVRNDWVLWRGRKRPSVRLDIHPADLEYPAVARWWLRTLERLVHERESLTKAAWVARWS